MLQKTSANILKAETVEHIFQNYRRRLSQHMGYSGALMSELSGTIIFGLSILAWAYCLMLTPDAIPNGGGGNVAEQCGLPNLGFGEQEKWKRRVRLPCHLNPKRKALTNIVQQRSWELVLPFIHQRVLLRFYDISLNQPTDHKLFTLCICPRAKVYGRLEK